MERAVNLAFMEEYKCSTCQQKKLRHEFHESNSDDRPCSFVCKDCRSNKYFASRYGTKCSKCEHYGFICSNDVCRKCNKEMGLRQCKKCHKVLPMALCFYDNKTTCKSCLRIYHQERYTS